MLLHGELLTFNFHFPKFQKVLWFIILPTTRNHYSWFWIHQIIQIDPRKSEPFLEILAFEISSSQNSKMLEKTRADKSLRSVLSNLENLEYGINIFRKTWNGNLGSFQFKYRNPSHPPTGPPTPSLWKTKREPADPDKQRKNERKKETNKHKTKWLEGCCQGRKVVTHDVRLWSIKN